MIATSQKIKLLINAVLAVIVTGLFVIWAAKIMDVGEIGTALKTSSVSGWLMCSIFMAIVSWLRFLRVQFCVPKASTLSLYRASALHGIAISVLPGKLGEAVLPLALNQLTGMSLLGSTGLLFLIRLFDLAVITVIALIAYTIAGLGGEKYSSILIILTAASIFGVAILPLAVNFGVSKIPISSGGIGRMIGGLTEALTLIGIRQSYQILGLSAAVWVCLGMAGYASIAAMGLLASPTNAALSVALGSYAFALPVNGVASAGPFEAAFAFALGLFDLELGPSLAAAAHFHICAVVISLLAALLGQAIIMVQLLISPAEQKNRDQTMHSKLNEAELSSE